MLKAVVPGEVILIVAVVSVQEEKHQHPPQHPKSRGVLLVTTDSLVKHAAILINVISLVVVILLAVLRLQTVLRVNIVASPMATAAQEKVALGQQNIIKSVGISYVLTFLEQEPISVPATTNVKEPQPQLLALASQSKLIPEQQRRDTIVPRGEVPV